LLADDDDDDDDDRDCEEGRLEQRAAATSLIA